MTRAWTRSCAACCVRKGLIFLSSCAMQTCRIKQFLQCGLWKWAGHQKLPQDFWLSLRGNCWFPTRTSNLDSSEHRTLFHFKLALAHRTWRQFWTMFTYGFLLHDRDLVGICRGHGGLCLTTLVFWFFHNLFPHSFTDWRASAHLYFWETLPF